MFTCVLINLWKFIPFPTILVLATLQTIPKELYDAASIDGASALQQFRYITYPHLKRILTVMGILGFIWTFNSFDIPYLLTEGGPGNATETLPLFIYRKAFLEFRLGEAAATTLIMFIILLAYTLLHFKFGVFAIPLTIFSTLLICILHNLGWV
jgi:ABC-type sugar transport system permease subunit